MIFRSLACDRKGAVLGKCSFSMNVFQVNTKFIITAYSQPMYLVQTEPELTVQIARTAFVIIPSAEQINRAISPLLKHCPTSNTVQP